MAFVITQPCIGSKDASCVDVCPVDCIHPTPEEPDFEEVDHLFVNANECIDCGACETACPVNAILPEEALSRDAKQWVQINANYFQR